MQVLTWIGVSKKKETERILFNNIMSSISFHIFHFYIGVHCTNISQDGERLQVLFFHHATKHPPLKLEQPQFNKNNVV